jgi:hypothetical protein
MDYKDVLPLETLNWQHSSDIAKKPDGIHCSILWLSLFVSVAVFWIYLNWHNTDIHFKYTSAWITVCYHTNFCTRSIIHQKYPKHFTQMFSSAACCGTVWDMSKHRVICHILHCSDVILRYFLYQNRGDIFESNPW